MFSEKGIDTMEYPQFIILIFEQLRQWILCFCLKRLRNSFWYEVFFWISTIEEFERLEAGIDMIEKIRAMKKHGEFN
jgi:hypothetical protein